MIGWLKIFLLNYVALKQIIQRAFYLEEENQGEEEKEEKEKEEKEENSSSPGG